MKNTVKDKTEDDIVDQAKNNKEAARLSYIHKFKMREHNICGNCVSCLY